MSSQQLPIDFDLLALPRPSVATERLRNGDVSIGDDPLIVPRQLKHGVEVLGAIERLSGNVSLNGLIYPPAAAGYTQIREGIQELYSIVLAHSGIELTIRQLLRLGFLKCSRPPQFNLCAQYQTLTRDGKEAMLRGVNATHFRIYRNQVLLIAPVYGRPHVI